MSIMRSCEFIGEELRKTKEGKQTIELYEKLTNDLHEEDKYLFFQAENKVNWGLHFYVTEAVVSLLKTNAEVDNEYLRNQIKRILSNIHINNAIMQMHSMGDFIEKISLSILKKDVQYILPKEISPTPKLVRYIQDLSVECQKVNIIQQLFMKINKNPSDFKSLFENFDILKNTIIGPPYTKKDRQIIKRLSSMGYNKEDIELIYTFDNINRMVKQTIYDSFVDRIFKINQKEQIEEMKQKNVGMLKVAKMKFTSDGFTNSQNKWIIKLVQEDGNIMFGQIYTKQMKFQNNLWENTANAILYKNM